MSRHPGNQFRRLLPRFVASLAVLGACLLPGCDGSRGGSPATSEGSRSTSLHEVRFQVDGMHCGACAEAITAELATDPARSDISVSHDTRLAIFFVGGDAGEAHGRAVKAAASIRGLGFVVTELQPGQFAGPVVTAPDAAPAPG